MEFNQLSLKDWKDWSEVARNFVFVFAGIAAGVGIWLAWRRTKALETQADTDAERHITENFTRAIDQLGKGELEVRLGAIYALERIAKTSQKDHWPIMEILTAYVRNNASWPPKPKNECGPVPNTSEDHQESDAKSRDIPSGDGDEGRIPPPDIQAVLTVIARRNVRFETELQEIDLSHSDLRGANLEQISLQRAQLAFANFDDANFHSAKLNMANFLNAKLGRAVLWNASLEMTTLVGADLNSAFFEDADLAGADLSGANLEDAEQLSQEQLNVAFGNEHTRLPLGLTVPNQDE